MPTKRMDPVAIRATFERWAAEGDVATHEPFVGILVYAKTPGSFERIGLLATHEYDWRSRDVGDLLPFSAQGRGWGKAVLVGKATTVEAAMALMFPHDGHAMRAAIRDVWDEAIRHYAVLPRALRIAIDRLGDAAAEWDRENDVEMRRGGSGLPSRWAPR